MNSPLIRTRTMAAAALGLVSAAALSACSSIDNAEVGGGGEGVPVGASAAQYQAALADMEPVELTVQWHTASATDPGSPAMNGFLERVTEYSGGKITFDVTYAHGITGNVLDNDDALIDGRLDIAHVWPQYDPAEYPVNNLLLDASVVRDPRQVTGYFSIMAAMQEVGLGTPEAMAEWTDKGLTPLNIMSSDGSTIVACTSPIVGLADLQGRQIRAGGTVHARQIEALGAVPVSLPYTEVYEALQRGILDCSMSAHWVATAAGHVEVAPFIYHTETASFASTPTNLYAGPRLEELPLAAQQLIVESAQYMAGNSIGPSLDRTAGEMLALAEENGGGYYAFAEDIEQRLAQVNEDILADLEANPLLDDGTGFVSRLTQVNDKWVARVGELGYLDEGPTSTFPEWYPGDYDSQPWIDAVIADIISQHRPE